MAAVVTFSYKDAWAGTWRRMTLPGEEFLRRFLQHVLPPGFHRVRLLWALDAGRAHDACPPAGGPSIITG
jgi:hypothetical protein